MKVGLIIGIPPMVLPFLFPGEDRNIPWRHRYTTKASCSIDRAMHGHSCVLRAAQANLWIFVMSWIGNYFWTHYFYKLLGAKYTFPAHRLNGVPFALTFITHSYFHLYFELGNLVLRKVW